MQEIKTFFSSLNHVILVIGILLIVIILLLFRGCGDHVVSDSLVVNRTKDSIQFTSLQHSKDSIEIFYTNKQKDSISKIVDSTVIIIRNLQFHIEAFAPSSRSKLIYLAKVNDSISSINNQLLPFIDGKYPGYYLLNGYVNLNEIIRDNRVILYDAQIKASKIYCDSMFIDTLTNHERTEYSFYKERFDSIVNVRVKEVSDSTTKILVKEKIDSVRKITMEHNDILGLSLVPYVNGLDLTTTRLINAIGLSVHGIIYQKYFNIILAPFFLYNLDKKNDFGVSLQVELILGKL